MDYPGKVIIKTPVTPTQTSASGNWTLDDAAAAIKNNNWPVAGVPNPISKSLRFNSADSAYLNRTFSTPTDGKKWTWSGWVKRGLLTNGTGTAQQLFSAGSATAFFRFSTTDTLLSGWTGAANLETTQVFRDASAWYHIILVVDTTQATASNRVKYYVNGSQITAFSSTDYPTQNSTTTINSAVAHNIGAYTSSTQYFNGYMTEVNFIDGQALTPSSFGMTDPQTGVWEPIKYTGTYGTNGFYLNFKDATSTTTLGYDYSGNSNNWTTNNFSVTAGVGNDSLTDVPTPWTAYNTTGDVGGVIRGNYCTLNPLDRTDSNTSVTNGNLTAQGYLYGGSDYRSVKGTMYQTEKFYFEATISNTGSSADWYGQIGIANSSFTCPLGTRVGGNANSWAFIIRGGSGDVAKLNNNSATQLAASLPSAGDVIMVACDPANGKVWFGRNGTWYGSGDPAAGTNAAYTNVSSSVTPAAGMYYNLDIWNTNFGQRPFAYTPPAGFLSLNTTNLPTPTIGSATGTQAGNYMNIALYTGNGSSQSITGLGFQPDFTWIKSRSGADNHNLFNAVVGAPNRLFSNLTNAENTTAGTLTSFNSDGFSVGSISDVNANAVTFVAWNWKAAGSTVSNTAGTITSTVSASTASGFSVVTYTGNGSASTKVGHGLGVAPSMMIVKQRGSAGTNWAVYHASLPSAFGVAGTQVIYLNATTANTQDFNVWDSNNTEATRFSVGASTLSNANGGTYVAYCFAPIAGYSAFGSYTGNGSADGPFVYLGFRPRWLLLKVSSTTGDWVIYDTSRNTYNVMDLYLYPNSSAAEAGSGTPRVDALSNGFKLRNTGQDNTSGATYIYACFAESPFKYANAR